MQTQTALVAFHGHEILTINDSETIRVAIAPICNALGLQPDAQRKRIQRHPVMSQGASITDFPSDGGIQKMLTLPLDMLNGWLFGVEASRVKPEIRERLVEYQRECFKVLHDYWAKDQSTRTLPPAPTSRAIEDSYALAAALLPEIAKAIQSGLTGKTYRWFLSFDHLRKPFITSIPDDAYMLSHSDMLKTMMSADGAPLKTEELEVFINAATRKLASRAVFHQQRALALGH